MGIVNYMKKLTGTQANDEDAGNELDKPYSSLMQSEDMEMSSENLAPTPPVTPNPRVAKLVKIAHWTVHVLLLGIIAFLLDRSRHLDCRPKSPVFSPADRSIDWEVVKFTSGLFNDTTIYQQYPTPEVDEAWYGLYRDVIASKISPEDATKLDGITIPYPLDHDFNFVAIEAFHQIHCLNVIRRSFYPEYYNIMDDDHVHRDHCMDEIRQLIMCTGDTTPIRYVWNEEKGKIFGIAQTTHYCRNYKKLYQWGLENRADTNFKQTDNPYEDPE